ncbi:transposase [Limobrevibacterium gyesilva]|uniref:Transposase n=1 Tax=Limobrevibacterium gyesilva TaxID=2991712 RepID=A0AA41YPY7_9PROT|nr:transposase [Limobrevibacterium gyesilva]
MVEDLDVQAVTVSARGDVDGPGSNVARKAGLNRAILSVGWGTATRMLGYKTVWYGAELVRVPAVGTSQTCRMRGHRDPDSWPSRDVFRCTACGYV